ncbi:MAG: hypothetical protein ACN6PQ_16180 [Stenotrophomonas indicatrix]|jgi:hypothetical protein|uniref:hypothetical protein n=1 Tax=Stenotrophomonas indicatrix TaxID=2045451 RepID=UPI000FB42A5D
MSDTPHPVLHTLFLPLQRKTLARFIGHGTAPQTALEQAGLMAALLCRQRLHSPAQVERLLHDACALFAADSSAATTHLAGQGGGAQPELDAWLSDLAANGVLLAPAEIAQAFLASSPQHYPGLALQQACQETLSEHSIRFPAAFGSEEDVADDAVEAADADTHAIERNGLYTSEQARVLRTIAANPDELIDLDGYAGTGKGHLVLALMDARPGRYTYVAPMRGQVEAFRARVRGETAKRLLTQIEFANLLAQHAARTGRTGGFVATYRISTLSAREIAARIGLQGVGSRTPEQMLRTALDAITLWCASSATSLQPWHFKRTVHWSMINAEPYIAAAEHVWRCMFDSATQRGGCLSLTTGHIGKWLALRGVAPPVEMGMLLIDEAHDLSPSWRQLLAAHAPGVVSLGDPHQRLSGSVPRWNAAKVVEMHQSVRQGSQVDGLVNQALAMDYLGRDSGPFMGATDRATGVLHYADWSQVPDGGIRIYGDLLRLMQDAARLHVRGARVHIHPSTLRLLNAALRKPIEAWNTVREGGSLRDWERVVEQFQERGEGALADLFSRSDSPQTIMQTLQALVPAEESQLVLCLAEHAKNLQFEVVSMSDCCFRAKPAERSRHSPVRAAYVAMTRASRQLWVPEGAMEHLQTSAAQHESAKQEQQLERQHAAGHRPRR